ncbi:collagenase [Actinokineospora soli]|uniref:microbial collagenase n=1 Tax=Actinokineospora soli TaxID=1048753 RepID=A0ABW2TQF3_9PSEU
MAQRPPLPSSTKAHRVDYDLAPAAASDCGIVGLTGAALADKVASSPMSCVNALFLLTGADARSTFSESQMITVAERLRSAGATYPGDDSTGAARLTLFLRAGYYVHYYDPTVGQYGPALTTATRSALDTYFAAPRAFDVSQGNGTVLGEAVTLVDSADLGARYLHVVQRLLTSYHTGYNQFPSMVNAVNSVYTVLFRGHYRPEFLPAVTTDLLATLRDFAQRNVSLLSGPQSFLTSNAGRELARFLQYDSLRATVRPMVQQLFGISSIRGATAPLWVGLAEMADAYDKANCSAYGTCDLQAKLAAEILPITHTCASTLRIRAQEMTSAQLTQTCSSLLNQDAYFHSVAKDPGPVTGDRNTSLEVVVYNSSTDYRTYAGAMWGIDTNNGGMYLEGDPSATGNQARFIAYEAEWLRPAFAIWNLNHEYTHYLDGRFNLHGDFDSNVTTPTVWWIEGFAEYVSYSYRDTTYTEAITEAGKRTYALSTLFGTTYNHDTMRVYRWGYLAVRYMIQSHRADVDTVLGHYRRGDWNSARAFLTGTVGSRYDSDWYSWLSQCATGQCGGTGANQPPTADFTSAVSGRTATFTDRSTDPDGTITARRWDFGDGTSSTATSPGHTYAADGTYTVTLRVTDSGGLTATTSRAVTIGTGECTGADTRLLGNGCVRSNRSATASGYDYMYVLLPAGTSQLRITSSGGTGNCDLYYSPSSWATTTTATHRSTASGNTESITVSGPPSGYVYVSLRGNTSCSGVAVTARY